jgi:hypothetical protein
VIFAIGFVVFLLGCETKAPASLGSLVLLMEPRSLRSRFLNWSNKLIRWLLLLLLFLLLR